MTESKTSLPRRTRTRIEYAIIDHELRSGKGTHTQRLAYQELEWRRCAADPIYFIEKYGWIVAKSGDIIKWELWPFQAELLKEWATGESTCAVKARQLGVTTLSIHFALWEIIFKEAARWYAVSTSEQAAVDMVERLQVTMDRLPKWMTDRAKSRGKQNVNKKRDQGNAVKRVAFGFSTLVVLTSTPKSVSGKSGNFILDEFAKHDQQRRVYQTLLPAFDGGGQAIIIANGNGENTFYHIYQRAKKGDNKFTPHFFSWRDDPNRDNDWYDRTKKDFFTENADSDEYAFKAEYPSSEDEAFFLSGNSRFDLDAINIRFKGLQDYKEAHDGPFPDVGFLEPDKDGFRFVRKSRRGRLRLYFRPEPGAEYVVGVDPAGGGQDANYSVVSVGKLLRAAELGVWAERFGLTLLERWEPGDLGLLQVATYQAKADPDVTALMAERLARWYNDALVVIERNNHGHAVIGNIKDQYFNLWIDRDPTKLAEDPKENIGYQENKASKTHLIDDLSAWVSKGWYVITDSNFLTELSRFEIHENGSMGAPKGSTDDLVIGGGLTVVGAKDMMYASKKRRARILDPFRE